MGLISGMREASSSFSPSANSVGDGRSTKTMAFVLKSNWRLLTDTPRFWGTSEVSVLDPPLIYLSFSFRRGLEE